MQKHINMRSKTEIQNEIVDVLVQDPHGIADLSPRIGKTRIGINVIKKLKPKKILWVTPDTKLRDEDIPREFETWKAKTYLYKTKIVCWASLAKVKGHYDIVILDELQYITEANSSQFFSKKITYNSILCLTGTVPKGEDKIELIEKLGLKTLYKVSIDDAQASDLIADYGISVILTNLDNKAKVIASGSKKNPFYQTEFAAYNYINSRIQKMLYSGRSVPAFMYIQRMNFIKLLPSKENMAKKLLDSLPGRTLIFCGSIEQAERLCEHTHHSKKKNTTDYDAFIAGRIPKLACVNSGGVGSTYRGVDNFIIVQADNNKNGGITQKIARSLVHQEGYKANIIVLAVEGTMDVDWVRKSLEDFNSKKINWVSARNYE